MKKGKFEILESLRGFAAVYVVLHHISLFQMPKKSAVSYLFSLGQAAVMLFFVISGFVIYYACYSISKENFSFRNYFIKRFRRIYPVFLAALAISYITESLSKGTWLPADLTNLFGNLINMQDAKRIPGMWFDPYYRNTPLWSLSYEWWFYLLFFPIFKWIKAENQKNVVLAISIIGFITFYFFPNKVSINMEYFIIWWSGVEVARSWIKFGKITNGTIRFLFYSYGTMLLLLVVQLKLYKGKIDMSDHPGIELLHFIYSAIILIVGFLWNKYKFIGYKYLLRPFLIFAPISYGIYVFHAPLVYKHNIFNVNNLVLQDICGFAATIIVSYLFEVVLQKRINNFSKKFINEPLSKTNGQVSSV